jgi:hypothetical protein
MKNILASFLKSKKILIFALLTCISVGMVVPQKAYAVVPIIIAVGIGIAKWAAIGGSIWWAASSLTAEGQNFFKALVMWISDSLFYAASQIAYTITGWFNDLLSTEMMTKTILKQQGFVAGWIQSRDLANMLIVLGFVVVGIAFTLRIENYGTKKTLISLIIIALLINFSGLFVGLIIDASNILITHFLRGGNSVGRDILTSFYNLANDPNIVNWEVLAKEGSLSGYLMWCVFFTMAFVLIAITFFYLVVILLASRAIFGILFVLSPIAFFCRIFPATKNIWTMWWENLFKWAFIGIQISFFTYIAGIMLGSTQKASVIELISILVLLYVAVTVARKSSAAGATAAIGLATGAAGLAMGAAGGTVKGLANSRAGQATQRGLTVAGEKIGLVAPGTSNLMRQKHMQEHDSEKRVKTLPDDKIMKDGFTGRAPMTRRGRNDKFEMIKQSVESGKAGEWLTKGEITQDEYDNAVGYYQSRGGSMSALAEKDYRVAGYGKTGAAAQQAKNTQLSENISKGMTGKQIRSIDPNDLDVGTNPNIIKDQFTPAMARQFKTASPRLKEKAMDHVPNLRSAAGVAGRAGDIREQSKLNQLADALEKATDPTTP